MGKGEDVKLLLPSAFCPFPILLLQVGIVKIPKSP
jgi:hypothetical protein